MTLKAHPFAPLAVNYLYNGKNRRLQELVHGKNSITKNWFEKPGKL